MSTIIQAAAPTTSHLSRQAYDALLEAVAGELEASGHTLDHALISTTINAMLPHWLEWDARGGFAPGADHAALFAAWEREDALTQ